MEIKQYLNNKQQQIDRFIEYYFSASPIEPGLLKESMVYSLSAGGKRIRPVLCLTAYEACGGEKAQDIIPFASALELIHTYSLIHDDLPSMDNDDLRRGKPTNHKIFGEAMAILAGDALLTEAFYLLSSYPKKAVSRISSDSILKIISDLSQAVGAYGMVGGQAQDILSEDKEPDKETLSFIHLKKTAALITVSVRMGGLLADCNADKLENLTKYGENIGLGFQIIDDILDIEGDSKILGKTAGSDEKKKKMTYPKLYGLDSSKKKAEEVIRNAIESLSQFDEKADPLRGIALYLLSRKS